MPEGKLTESGIMYKAGVKKYGKEGMTKIQSAAGKDKGHEEIGKIKDKYEKGKKEGVVKEAYYTNVDKKLKSALDKTYSNLTSASKLSKKQRDNKDLTNQIETIEKLMDDLLGDIE